MIRRTSPVILSVAAALALLWHAQASNAQSFLATGDDAGVTAEGLHRVNPLIMEAAWVRPGFDLSRYKKVLLMPTAVQFRQVPKRPVNARSRINTTVFPLPESRKKWLRQTWQRAVDAEFSQEQVYKRYNDVGPDVLVAQAFLVDVVSRIPPETVGSSYTYVTDPWSVYVVLELRDAMTTQLIARTIDQEIVHGQAEIGEVWYRTQDLVDKWAKVLSYRLGDLAALGGWVGKPPMPVR